MKKKKARLEAALFMATSPLSIDELCGIVGEEENIVRDILESVKQDFSDETRGMEIFETDKGIELRVKDEHLPDVYHLTPHSDLGKGLLKALALVAFKQPIKQSDIVKLIGNRTYEYVKDLEDRNFIRSEKHGRTKKLSVSDNFYQYFRLAEGDLEKLKKKADGDEESTDVSGSEIPPEGTPDTGGGESTEDLPEKEGSQD